MKRVLRSSRSNPDLILIEVKQEQTDADNLNNDVDIAIIMCSDDQINRPTTNEKASKQRLEPDRTELIKKLKRKSLKQKRKLEEKSNQLLAAKSEIKSLKIQLEKCGQNISKANQDFINGPYFDQFNAKQFKVNKAICNYFVKISWNIFLKKLINSNKSPQVVDEKDQSVVRKPTISSDFSLN